MYTIINLIRTYKSVFTVIVMGLLGYSQIFAQAGEVNTADHNVLDFKGIPAKGKDLNQLSFSDQGAWFSYGFPNESSFYGGFVGPYLMMEQNGVWLSQMLSQLSINDVVNKKIIDWKNFKVEQNSFLSHLQQKFLSKALEVNQTLFYVDKNTALIYVDITNRSKDDQKLEFQWHGKKLDGGFRFEKMDNGVMIYSEKNNYIGYIKSRVIKPKDVVVTEDSYLIIEPKVDLKVGESTRIVLTQSFLWSKLNLRKAINNSMHYTENPDRFLKERKQEKKRQLEKLEINLDAPWRKPSYQKLLAKSLMTLQNNWRSAAGDLKYDGFFPSYHQDWFHGFWAWDSWKHASAVAIYDIDLAKDQIRAIFNEMDDNGFIPDCIFRDSKDEEPNLRNTKPPLAAWAVWNIYQVDKDKAFLNEMYYKILRQHKWWYKYRDHDQDGLCEYGSNDGTLEAAKWESGMDNAVRFDQSRIVENESGGYSLNQESVDLNAYLYAEKEYLRLITNTIGQPKLSKLYSLESNKLKKLIQEQFYDDSVGWFYDTSIDGTEFVHGMGCEGWIPLWANLATQEQATKVKENMLKTTLFNTKVPFQTLSASHPEFNPADGYWRGPNWLDQSYFAIQGLHNYGFHEEADGACYKLLQNAQGVLTPGESLRENYNPMTGEGLEAKNFSWTAAHIILMLQER